MSAVLGEKKSGSEIQELLQKAKGTLFKKGDAEAQFKLGKTFEEGQGVAKDLKQAAEWYQRAANQSHGWAQFRLGLMYAHGEGVPQNVQKASVLLQECASNGPQYETARQALMAVKGDAQAQCRLGLIYANGEGVYQDLKKAFEWVEKSVKQGNEGAKLPLSAIQGDADSQYTLGLMYLYGEGTSPFHKFATEGIFQDDKIAVEWLEKAAGHGWDGRQAKDILAEIKIVDELIKRFERGKTDDSHLDYSNCLSLNATGTNDFKIQKLLRTIESSSIFSKSIWLD